jgi:hypothetical protein
LLPYLQNLLGIEFPQLTPPTPDSWYISEGLSPPQRDFYVPVDPVIDMSNWKPKKKHRRSKRRKIETKSKNSTIINCYHIIKMCLSCARNMSNESTIADIQETSKNPKYEKLTDTLSWWLSWRRS